MSKISEEAARALTGRYKFSKDNTSVLVLDHCAIMSLFGKVVARRDGDGLHITLAGWPTVTTRSRLNALPGVHVHQHKGEQYLNGEPWDGSWTTI